MPTTPNYGLTYPDSSAHARTWEHWETLALDTDSAMVVPMFRARRSAAQSIANASETLLLWDAEDVDTHAGHDLVTNPSRYVCQVAGWYQLSGGVGFVGAGTGTGRRGAFWRKNGTTLDGSASFFPGGSTGSHSVPARVMLVQLAVNDYVEMAAFQEQGSALNTGAGSSQPSIDVVYWRPV